MQPLSLSTSWNSRRHKNGGDMLREIRDLGFEYAELGHGIRYSLWPGIEAAVKDKVIRISSVHNFCPVPLDVLRPSPNCYQFTDLRPSMRRSAIKCTIDTIRHAVAVNAPAVVMHLGSSGQSRITSQLEDEYESNHFLSRAYTQTKVEAVKWRKKNFQKTWERLQESLEPVVAEAVACGVRLGFEIREKFEEFPHEEEMGDVLGAYSSQVVGYWHDFGHAARKGFLGWLDHEEVLVQRKNRIFGCHVHDCYPPGDDHLPLGQGLIDFPTLCRHLPDSVIPVLELNPFCPREDVVQSHKLWPSYFNSKSAAAFSS